MRILITGAAGQLGTELCRQLAAGGSELGPLPAELHAAEVVPVDLEQANLARLPEAMELVATAQPDVVINCAAYTNVDGAETDRDTVFAANALLPRNLAMACQHRGAKLLHPSTDYVFDGLSPVPYTEADVPAPVSVYGKTKYLGEQYAAQFCSRTFVVRTSWLYGLHGKNFVKTILRLADEREELKVVADQLGNPTSAEDLAHHLLAVAATEEYGLYHCTGAGICSWFDFATEIVRLSGKKARVLPCTSDEYPSPVKRPANSALDHAMLRATVGDCMRPWQQALESYLSKMEEFS